ncbi:MAG: helix-hairpin-helix domain-containing protein [Bacilli bacterium]|nr:helix-hairpin-helix domain-containing protein [Bacilli bacterium]
MDFYFALIFDYLKKNILTFIVIILSVLNLIIGLNFKKLDNTSNDIEKTLSNSEELISNTLEEPKVTEAKETIRVDVKGMVKKAGVYELAKDSIVNDAIKKAGGLTSKADTTNVNLSKSLTNEMVIYIPKKEEVTKSTVNDALVDKSNSVGFIDNESSNETTNTTTKVNINTATLKDLITLNGIGESKAQAILEYRTKNGNFKTLEDLKKVSGIGEAAYEKIKDNICI